MTQFSPLIMDTLTSPLGALTILGSNEGICFLGFADQKHRVSQLKKVEQYHGAQALPGKHPYFDLVQTQLNEYFAGTRTRFEIPLTYYGTPFQCTVWNSLATIPYGQTRSYSAQAHSLQNPDAVRAVAAANGQNPFVIVVPCHRVIGKTGKLTGYGGGLSRKEWLLHHETQRAALVLPQS